MSGPWFKAGRLSIGRVVVTRADGVRATQVGVWLHGRGPFIPALSRWEFVLTFTRQGRWP